MLRGDLLGRELGELPQFDQGAGQVIQEISLSQRTQLGQLRATRRKENEIAGLRFHLIIVAGMPIRSRHCDAIPIFDSRETQNISSSSNRYGDEHVSGPSCDGITTN